jgi:diguanylate cyclase (GGDEF)-like protein
VPALLLIDLDGFKTINDSLGHGAGDEVLVAVARCLETCVRPSDTVARLGGDEFAILIEEGVLELATGVADRILRVLAEPLVVAGRQLYVNASIGVTLGGEGRDADVLVRDADVAMYAAKARGKGRYEVFQPHMHAVAVQRQELLGDLQQALEKGQFSLVYQPVFDLESRRMDGWEALLRWDHPTRGQVPPLDFIAIAEETGLIVRIGRWVLREACRQAVQWQQRFPGAEEMTMSVNISARQLKEPSLVEDVRAVLADTGLDPRTLMLEITESSMLDLDAVRRPLDELKGAGRWPGPRRLRYRLLVTGLPATLSHRHDQDRQVLRGRTGRLTRRRSCAAARHCPAGPRARSPGGRRGGGAAAAARRSDGRRL